MSKELLFKTLRHEETERAPWVPFAGVHAGALIGADATQVLTDEELLVKLPPEAPLYPFLLSRHVPLSVLPSGN